VQAKIAEAIDRLVNSEWPGVVAVSGGADSVALLRALHEIAPVGGLVVAHLNHQLRGEESDADEAFVQELAEQLGRTCRTKRVDVGLLSQKTGANLEATARSVRYQWLAEVAAEVGASWIATGHTADDQAETVLHRLIRGAGVQGLRGIAESRTIPLTPNRFIIRPMLGVTRGEVIEYLASLNQTYREDASNADPRFTRNRIRHELLPLLRTFNPAIVATLDKLANQSEELFAEQELEAIELTKLAELPRAGSMLVFDAEKLSAMNRRQVRALFRYVWQREGWPTNSMTFAHWERAASVAVGDPTAADFPGGLQVRRSGDSNLAARRSRALLLIQRSATPRG